MWVHVYSMLCIDSVLSRCHIFCQLPAKIPHLSAAELCACMCIVCVYVLTLCCQDVSSFVSYLPRCPIFRQAELCVCMCIMCVYVLTLCCQDVTSFVSYLPRCPIFRQMELHVCVHVCVHVYYNVCPCAYALTLLSRYFVTYLPSCPIFGRLSYVCVCMCTVCTC